MKYLFWFILSMIEWKYCLISSTLLKSPILITLSILGGAAGIVIFTQIGYDVEKWLVKKFPKRFKRFSFKNRILARVRRKWGIWGIALISPILIGLPVGVVLGLTLTTLSIFLVLYYLFFYQNTIY